MHTKPQKRVRLTARNVHNNKTRTLTLYDVDCDQMMKWIQAKLKGNNNVKTISLSSVPRGRKRDKG